MPGEEFEPEALRSHGLRLKAVRAEKRECDFVASTDAIDSYGEIVDQESWQLDRYDSNPVVLFGHQSRELPIGKCTRCEVMKQGDGRKALECTIRFATEDMNPKAEQVFKMVQDGMLRAVSVGFNPHTYSYEKRDDREVCILRDNELFEISVVPIPANHEALAKARAKARAAHLAEHGENAMKTLEEALKAIEAKDAAIAEGAKALDAERSARKAADAVVMELTGTVESGKRVIESIRAALGMSSDDTRVTFDVVKLLIADRDKAAADLVDAKVKALVGVKILPTEIETMTELAKSNAPLFEKMMAQRGDLSILKSVMTPDPKPTNAVEQAASGDELAAEIERMSNGEGSAADTDLTAA